MFLQPQPANVGWTTYNGVAGGNRYSSLSLINTGNVSGLKAVAKFVVPRVTKYSLEATPLVASQNMFVTSTNSVFCYNLVTNSLKWSFTRPPTNGVTQDAIAGFNRGVALSHTSVFLITDNAHLLSLNISTGALQWETTMADYTQNYGATGAPLYLPGPNLVICGVSGGDSGARGFVAAFDGTTGNLVWQFWTTPSGTSDPLAASWGSGAVLPHGCGATWMTGTYDPATNTVYWGVGNPCRNFNGDDRQGDNLYSSSVVALNASTGALNWYFQFTPHNLWDYDGVNTPMLIDTTWQGTSRHLMFHANRNGYFYVLDRGTGQFLAGFPFVTNLTWATGLDGNGRPIVNPAAIPTSSGVQACPASVGATSWMSSAFSPMTGLFYVQALEACFMFTKGPLTPWQPGQDFDGGEGVPIPGQPGHKHLRALNPATGTIVWDYSQPGTAGSFGGVLATAGGLVFVAEDGGAFSALDAATGNRLWTASTLSQQLWKASPMTYELNGRQFVAIAFPSAVVVYGL